MQTIQTRLEHERIEYPFMSHHRLEIFTQCFKNYFMGYSEISGFIHLGLKAITDKSLFQIIGSVIPVFIQLCLLVLIYEVVQLLQNFLGMSHFNRIINSVLRGCIEIDGKFLFFILTRDGHNSQPPTQTLSNFVENAGFIHKYQMPSPFYVCFCLVFVLVWGSFCCCFVGFFGMCFFVFSFYFLFIR